MKLKKVVLSILVGVVFSSTIVGVLVNTSEVIYASKSSEKISASKEEKKAINNLARALKEAHNAAPSVDEEQMARGVMAYVAGDAQENNLPKNEKDARIAALYGSSFFSTEKFGKCMLNKMGLGELKNLAKIIFKPVTIKYLKSHAWKKASAMIVHAIEKHASKKLARFAVKRIAKFALPGIGWGSVAMWGAECGWREFH